MAVPIRIIAIDWSGAERRAARKIWLAEVCAGELVRLESGRDRLQIAAHLIAEADRTPDLIVGFDFAFSFPAWFLHERGLRSAPELWDVGARHGEQWLAACDPPFWGRPGKHRPPHSSDPLRRTDRLVPAVNGIRPKSVFQIGGAGAVGTGSLRGMPILERLRSAGFAIWPFDRPVLPLVVEIYPRSLTGTVVKGSADARRRYLEERCPGLEPSVVDLAAASDDAFDALVSAFVMAAHVDELATLPDPQDLAAQLEGLIWIPEGATRMVLTAGEASAPDEDEVDEVDWGMAIKRCDRPGDDLSAWYTLLRSMLPQPVEEHEPGTLIGGEPGEVVVHLEPDTITIARFAVRWNGQMPTLDPIPIATFRPREARGRDVAQAITRASSTTAYLSLVCLLPQRDPTRMDGRQCGVSKLCRARTRWCALAVQGRAAEAV